MQQQSQPYLAGLGGIRDWRVATKLLVATAFVMIALTAIIDYLVVNQTSGSLENQLTTQVASSTRFLKFLTDQKGSANLRDGKLEFGGWAATNDFTLVDSAKNLTDSEATMYQFKDNEFVAINTTVLQADKTRAVGNVLQGPAAAALKGGKDYTGTTTILGKPYIGSYLLVRDTANRPVGALFSGQTTTFINQQENKTTSTVGLASLLVLVISLAILFGLLARWVTRPLKELESAARRITSGDYAVRVQAQHNDEFGQVAGAVNTMVEEITKNTQTQEMQTQDLQRQIVQLLDEVSSVAEGDLTVQAEVSADALGSVADSFNYMITELRQVIGRVNAASEQVASSTDEILATTDVLNRSAEQQAARIADTSTAVEEMAVSIQQVSENAAISAQVARDARNAADAGAQAVHATVAGMERIRTQVQETARKIERLDASSQEIGAIVNLIKDVADQTSVLALNAAIRAAAAGEHGKGFAVVAEEVRRLAERTTSASGQIDALVKGIQAETSEAIAAMVEGTQEVVAGAQVADEAGRALTRIDATSAQLAELIEAISLAAEQQARASSGIARAMGEISGITTGTTAGTQQAAASVAALAALADDLRASVATFRLDMEAPAPPATSRPRQVAPARESTRVAAYAGVAG